MNFPQASRTAQSTILETVYTLHLIPRNQSIIECKNTQKKKKFTSRADTTPKVHAGLG
jgi:hypothetical protein